jgi:hypothetical protein
MDSIDPNIAKHAAGPIGALSALLFMRGPWLQRILSFPVGCAIAFYGGPWLKGAANMPEGLAGFMVGLFGMAAVAKVFDTWENLALGDLIRKKVAQLLGVSDSKEQP